MAWFHKSLKEAKELIQRNDWERALAILKSHNLTKDKESLVKRSISEIHKDLNDYSRSVLYNMVLLEAFIRETQQADEDSRRSSIEQIDIAITAAERFEKTILTLIKEGKFME